MIDHDSWCDIQVYGTLVQSNIAASLKRSIIYKWNDMNTHQEPRIVHGCGT
jgi:hypothetical protein